MKTVVANYVLWPVAHFINFRFVPSQHRILYNNLVAVCFLAMCLLWLFLSFITLGLKRELRRLPMAVDFLSLGEPHIAGLDAMLGICKGCRILMHVSLSLHLHSVQQLTVFVCSIFACRTACVLPLMVCHEDLFLV